MKVKVIRTDMNKYSSTEVITVQRMKDFTNVCLPFFSFFLFLTHTHTPKNKKQPFIYFFYWPFRNEERSWFLKNSKNNSRPREVQPIFQYHFARHGKDASKFSGLSQPCMTPALHSPHFPFCIHFQAREQTFAPWGLNSIWENAKIVTFPDLLKLETIHLPSKHALVISALRTCTHAYHHEP